MQELKAAEDREREAQAAARKAANEAAMQRRIAEQQAEEKKRREELELRAAEETANNLRNKQIKEAAETNEALEKRRSELEFMAEQAAKAKRDAELILMTKVEEPVHPLAHYLQHTPE
jgi:cytochrome b involved in lipid metabolism